MLHCIDERLVVAAPMWSVPVPLERPVRRCDIHDIDPAPHAARDAPVEHSARCCPVPVDDQVFERAFNLAAKSGRRVLTASGPLGQRRGATRNGKEVADQVIDIVAGPVACAARRTERSGSPERGS